MAKKSFIAGSIVGAGLTALSILLFTPQDGEVLKEEIDFEIEDIKEHLYHTKDLEDLNNE